MFPMREKAKSKMKRNNPQNDRKRHFAKFHLKDRKTRTADQSRATTGAGARASLKWTQDPGSNARPGPKDPAPSPLSAQTGPSRAAQELERHKISLALALRGSANREIIVLWRPGPAELASDGPDKTATSAGNISGKVEIASR